MFFNCATITFQKMIKDTKKDLKSPLITTWIKKSSKCKQLLYDKFLKNTNSLNESEYKNYKKLFDSVKLHAKKLHYLNPITKYKNNRENLGSYQRFDRKNKV